MLPRGIGFWNSYIRTSAYLDREPENRPITAEELAKHTTKDDMWIGLRNGATGKTLVFVQLDLESSLFVFKLCKLILYAQHWRASVAFSGLLHVRCSLLYCLPLIKYFFQWKCLM